ncbi:MAG TPA: MFS transporter [Phycisphaerae bacterium]|nr:MFS transporter [Phycisphaerae bacterium]
MISSECRTAAHAHAAPAAEPATKGAQAVLWLSTAAFTLLFAVWLMFGVLAIPIRKELNLTEAQFSWLTAIAILNGSFWRLAFGILADKFGGRLLMTLLLAATTVPVALVSFAHSYWLLMLLAFFVGIAGNGFSIGIAWNSIWFRKKAQGTALGVFGAGNVGASVTKLIGPAMIALVPAGGLAGGIIPGGWRFIPVLYAVLLLIMALLTWTLTPADRYPGKGRPLAEILVPLKRIRVWRFSLYYVIVFGAYVALSVWLPHYYQDVYKLSLPVAAGLTALFIFPASLLRPVGGYLSDRYGPRRVMYAVFILMTLAGALLSLPNSVLTFTGIGGVEHTFHLSVGPALFTLFVFLLGVGMGVGKAAVYKYIPEYFPKDVGAVGGLVGALGGLGGFFLPPLFAYAQSATAMPQATFAVLLALTLLSFAWLHLTVIRTRSVSEAVLSAPTIHAASRRRSTDSLTPVS